MRIGKFVFRMRWKQADLKSRGKRATFGNYVAGAGQLNAALNRPPTREMAFVIPLGASVEKTRTDNLVQQFMVERFAVVVCLLNDTDQSDKYGFRAYDKVHDVRSEVLNAFLGWLPSEAETVIVYAGEKLLDFSADYLWYQYEFDHKTQLASYAIESGAVEGDVVDHGWQDVDIEEPTNLDRIYTQYILQPDTEGRLPVDPTQDLPLPDGFPDVTIPNIAQYLTREETE